MPTVAPDSIDAWLMGHTWVGSTLPETLRVLCDDIGVRWAGTVAEKKTAEFVRDRLAALGLTEVVIEPLDLQSWQQQETVLTIGTLGDDSLPIRPCLFCPPVAVTAELVDVGFGMEHELERLGERLNGAIALIESAFEPFSSPQSLVARLESLARRGVRAAICYSLYFGRRLTLMSASHWHDVPPLRVPLPLVQTAREETGRLQGVMKEQRAVTLTVEADFPAKTSWNNMAQLLGQHWPDESILLAAHHDTTPKSPGANDNAAGVAVLLEVARVLADFSRRHGTRPGRTIRFETFGAEKQGLQGSTAYVRTHHGPEPPPRLMLNLDELGVGPMKGVVLQFPELRPLVQWKLDEMNEGLRCHVLDRFDPSGDMFPFARAGIPSGMLWRWRFAGRHSNAEYGHCSSDTPEKLRLRELKEYAGNLARLMYRLSHVPPQQWPENRLDPSAIAEETAAQRGGVLRTM